MNAAKVLGRVLLASAAVFTTFCSFALEAQEIRSSHEIRKGDTLFAVARKAKYDNVTRNQMIVAIYRANPQVFPGGDPNRLVIGTVLAIPARDEVLKTEAAEADRLVGDMLASKPAAAAPTLAAVRPAPVLKPPAKPSAGVPPGAEAAAKRYREGVTLERRGDLHGAMAAYLESGEAGYGLAQRRLGQIYDNGNTAVERDYQLALKWYQKAREQGIPMDKPLQRTTPR